MLQKQSLVLEIALVVSTMMATNVVQAVEEGSLEEIVVVGNTPGPAIGIAKDKIPFAVQSANASHLEKTQSFDLTDFMTNNMASVSINSAQNNPLQPDVQFRGFTASPLLGLPQGISVYQNGVRINEPIGDAVNWDLLPESAISSIDLISGANPLFGLNTLGGALSVNMKDGFNYSGNEVEVTTGSWGRLVTRLQSGGSLSNSDAWGYYLNISQFEEEGWRELSESEALNFYGSLSWRNNDISAFNLNYQTAKTDLRGNGAAPIGLIEVQRSAIFTAPDITENDMDMFSMDASHFISEKVQVSAVAYWRENNTDSFNGDGSDYEECEYSGGEQSLFDDSDDVEDELDDLLGINLESICDGANSSVNNFSELETLINAEASLAGLNPDDFELDDIINDLLGTGNISDEGINNISDIKQQSQGFDLNLVLLDDLFSHKNHLTMGLSYVNGKSEFVSVLELSEMDPLTRSTDGLGVGSFVGEAATNVATQTETMSLFFTDTFNVNEKLSVTFGGRYNDSNIILSDRSGERPELNGRHNFARFNPSLGFTLEVGQSSNIYGSVSESNRVPTPIELACNEGVFEVAQKFAIAAGEDPDDVEFECRLPNAFLADPPLDDVVTRSYELGVRGDLFNLNYQLGIFHATNRDDILFQTTGRSTGLFANVDKTRRKGFESAFSGSLGKLDWNASYSYVEASYEDEFEVLSPNHPFANEEGIIIVSHGDRIPGIPEHLFKMSGDYYFNNSLSLGAEAIYNSSQVIRGDESNQLAEVGGYALVNLRASYQYSKWFTVFARVTNAFDTEYENFGLLGEDPNEILSLDDNRPLYLGVGAPRAAWIGVRFGF